MSRYKIDYGIDLGTTNSAIARIDNGQSQIIKNDLQSDVTASCVSINKKQAVYLGEQALNMLNSERKKAMEDWSERSTNCFMEFKRTMGTDKSYQSSHMGKSFTSEELSAEVLKRLKSFVHDEEVKTAVITVPARFTVNQKDATKRAADLAGFKEPHLLQEPIAASFAYGLDAKRGDGHWIVFDFGGGTFDTALLKAEEGVLKVIDTEGDNHLGGKNLDEEIIDKIIIPWFKETYSIDSILSDSNKSRIFKNVLKRYAEELKIQLSFNEEYNLLTDLGDIPGEDDNGEEFEIDLTINQEQLKQAVEPVFQKAIDQTKEILKRNNLNGNKIESLILIGGPTHSPILRNMLEEQICKPASGVDPMTAVARGAALYASTLDMPEVIREETRDKTKIQLDVGYESTTVEPETFVTIKTIPEKTEGDIPAPVFAELLRDDEAWSSGKKEINATGELIEAQLNEGQTNTFYIKVSDSKGDVYECEPGQIQIIQGTSVGSANLPYNIGIGIKRSSDNKRVFEPARGLEKNQPLPATGVINGLKTQKDIRPGNKEDFVQIPLYQGDTDAEGSRDILNHHIYDIFIQGDQLPELLPRNSDVDLTIMTDKESGRPVKAEAFFPSLDHTEEVEIPSDKVQEDIDGSWLQTELNRASKEIDRMEQEGHHNHNPELEKLKKEVQHLKDRLDQDPSDYDRKTEVLDNLRKSFRKVDQLEEQVDWPKMEQELNEELSYLEKANNEFGDEDSRKRLQEYRRKVEEVKQRKDVKLAKSLKDEMYQEYINLTFLIQLIAFIDNHSKNFNQYHWSDPNQARQLINEGQRVISEHPTVERLHPIVADILKLLPREELSEEDQSLLKK